MDHDDDSPDNDDLDGDGLDLGPETVLFLYSGGKVYRLKGELISDRQLERAIAATFGNGAEAARRIAANVVTATATNDETVRVPAKPDVPSVKSFDCPFCWRRGPAAESLDKGRIRCGLCQAVFFPGAKSPMAAMMATAKRPNGKAKAASAQRGPRPAALVEGLGNRLPSKKVVGVAVAAIAVVALLFVVPMPFLREGKPSVVPAAGEVTFDGKSIRGASIALHPLDKRLASIPLPKATVGEDGQFVVGTFGPDDGAPAGEYGVSIQWYAVAKDDSALPRNLLPPRYAHPNTSGLTVRIAPDDPRLPPIRLKR